MKRKVSPPTTPPDISYLQRSPSPTRPKGLKPVGLYAPIKQVGQGTYGRVFRARRVGSSNKGGIVAVKVIKRAKQLEGFPLTALREIMLLKELNHKNIVKLIEVVTDKQILPNGTMTDADDGWKGVLNSKEAEREPGVSFFMVMEYADHDLSGLIKKKLCTFTEPIIKDLIQQLLEGICYCHEHGVIHRDIKPSNLLLTSDGTLKIIDFGLAKKYAPGALMTLTVITLWYRAPEILLGDLNYGFPVDMWSIGCILAELFLGKPVLQGKAEAQQLDTIIRSCGEITEATWPGVSKLPGYEAIIQNSVGGGKSVSDTLKGIVPPMAMDLILSLLALDPAKRPTARMALDHPWFKSDPKPQKLIIENPEPEKGLVVSPVKQQPPPQKQQKSIPQFLLDPPK